MGEERWVWCARDTHKSRYVVYVEGEDTPEVVHSMAERIQRFCKEVNGNECPVDCPVAVLKSNLESKKATPANAHPEVVDLLEYQNPYC